MNTRVGAAGALLLSMGLLMLGNGLQGSLIALRASMEGFSTQIAGLLMSIYFVGFLAGSTLTPKIVARVGHVRVFAALASLASSAVVLHPLFIDAWLWCGLRLISGFCIAGLFVVAESWLNDVASNATRGRLLSLYVVITMAAMASGQMLLNLADPGGYDLFILITVLVSLALLPVLLSASPAPAFAAPEHLNLRALYRLSPLGLLGCVGTGLSTGAVMGMGVIYAQQIGLALGDIARYMGLVYAGSVLLQWPIGRLSDAFDRRRVIVLVTSLSAAMALLALVVVDAAAPLQLAVAFLFGGLSFPMYSLCVAHTNDALTPRQMVAASSHLVLAFGIGAALGPSLAAACMGWFGADGYYAYLALVHLAIGVFALYRMTRRGPVPLAEQGPCVPVAATASPLVMTMGQEGVCAPLVQEPASNGDASPIADERASLGPQ
ncbi:MFS transporter [Pseudomonas benzenivorans]|uniref:MFS transporter n=1 Tax=Pseudomonas benzenivorans TaxID=556533 RepID=A0ABY5H4G0_9PSED|nr:MFS transporter [Pseudomonas benzenivorans]UTW06983.1 MFS transporter [Pseudomonas benzenivorans]